MREQLTWLDVAGCCPEIEQFKESPNATHPDVERLRVAIAQLKAGAYDAVGFQCFSKEEADELKAALSPEERAVVCFSWLEFGV